MILARVNTPTEPKENIWFKTWERRKKLSPRDSRALRLSGSQALRLSSSSQVRWIIELFHFMRQNSRKMEHHLFFFFFYHFSFLFFVATGSFFFLFLFCLYFIFCSHCLCHLQWQHCFRCVCLCHYQCQQCYHQCQYCHSLSQQGHGCVSVSTLTTMW